MTIKDVAEKAGVSYTTVSHVINGTRRVNGETAERVHWAIKEMAYEPCASARSLKTGSSGIIGVMGLGSVDPYFSEVLSGIEGACREEGFGMLVCHSEGSPEREEANLRMLKSKGADAIIVNSPVGDSGFIRRLEELKIPVLVLQARLPDTSLDCLYTDDRGGASAAVSRLVDWGHERVACVTGIGMPYSSSNSRLQGYRDALLGSGIILSDDYVRLSDYSPRGGYECASELMGMDSPPTAIFLYSDLMALGALRALADLGKRVPRDVSVVGFDDLPLCEFSVPRLSSVSHAKADLGRKAVERIRARTSNPGLGPARTELPAMLVLRESAGNRAG